MAIPTSALQEINPGSIIELFTIELNTALHGSNTIYRFHNGANLNANGEVVWAGNSYLRFPIECNGFEFGSRGTLPRPTISVSNIFGTLTAIMQDVNATTVGNDLNGAKFTRIRTLARFLDAVNFDGNTNPYGTPDPTAEFPQEIYFLDRKVTENRNVVTWEAQSALDLVNVKLPARIATKDLFPGIGAFRG
jgi:lambda family phage minor tail protein L